MAFNGTELLGRARKHFRDWSEEVTRAAMDNQDKTFRQLVNEKIIPSWAEYVLNRSKY